jgi:hypothetical protein
MNLKMMQMNLTINKPEKKKIRDNKFICSHLRTNGIKTIKRKDSMITIPNKYCFISGMNLNNVACGLCSHFTHIADSEINNLAENISEKNIVIQN